METAAEVWDVVICGGGMAGLCLARQLRRELPEARVALLERTERPLPVACHKVGESSVELGSQYLATSLGLEAYLRSEHLEKNGLRFFSGDNQAPVQHRPEIGPPEFPLAPSFQIDRGKFENDLRAMNETDGVTLLEGASIEHIALAKKDAPHRIDYRIGEQSASLQARWVVDATGRRRFLQRQLGLQKASQHRPSAAWFRVAERVKISEVVASDVTAWHGRDVDQNRWLSTVHMMGPGYWLWLIPLSTGHTSIGIVADESHDFDTFRTEELAREWVRTHEPAVYQRIADLPLEDFRVMRNYSYSSHQVLSEDRWACVGEAGVFVDPLYSLGNDFIALSNSFTCRLIGDDLRDAFDPATARELDRTFLTIFEAACVMLTQNGPIFPHGTILGAKLWWDFFHYWAFVCQYFVQDIYRLPEEELARFREMGEAHFALNARAQRTLRSWATLKPEPASEGRPFIPLPLPLSTLADKHQDLLARRSPEATMAAMKADLQTGRELLTELILAALRDLGEARAREFGELARLEDFPLDPARLDAEALSRRERVQAIPAIARDLERALGRTRTTADPRGLWETALHAARHARNTTVSDRAAVGQNETTAG
ncbi:MAG: tryptophan 7-halogenase [Myxococcota bacterium]